jgi:hypothetical protein
MHCTAYDAVTLPVLMRGNLLYLLVAVVDGGSLFRWKVTVALANNSGQSLNRVSLRFVILGHLTFNVRQRRENTRVGVFLG